MKTAKRLITVMLVISMLVSIFALSVSAGISYRMDCTIYYVDESGNTLHSPAKKQADAIEKILSVPSPTISGYVLKNSSDTVVTYGMLKLTYSIYGREGTGTYTVVYKKLSSMTVYYLYTSGRWATSPKTVSGVAGAAFSITSPDVSGYTPDKPIVSGRFVGDLSMNVYYYPKIYTVSYSANGGSGAPTAQTKYWGDSIVLSSIIPARAGYSFAGWATSSSATAANYQPGGQYSGNADITLYAVWNPNTYTVSYNANGGTGAPASQSKYYSTTLLLSSSAPSRTGYTFSGWSTSSTAQTASFQPGGAYSLNQSTTLYAVWKIMTYSVNFNANGGSGAPGSQTKTYGILIFLPTTEPTRSGYSFIGWSTSSTATAASYQPGGSYTMNENTVLYAVWKQIQSAPQSYTVSYNANGGYGAPASQVKTQGVTLTLSSVRPSRSGYTFLGWSAYSGASSPVYYPGGGYYSDYSTVLYAVWQKNTEIYTVGFDANGGSGAPASQVKYEGTILTLSTVVPYRNGYDFIGWGSSAYSTTAGYYPGGTYSADSSVILYALWQYIPETYIITYNANGGSGAPAAQTKTENAILTLSPVSPSKEGSSFLGWAESSGTTVADYQPGGGFSIDADTTLYAVWENDSCDFSVSNLTVTPGTVYQYNNVTVKFQVDSWDRYSTYKDVPVEVILNGAVIYSSEVDFVAFGVNYITFTLSVGSLENIQTLTARINWLDRLSENNTENNSTAGTFTVERKMELKASAVTPNADYVEGNEVISSFFVSNKSSTDIIPSDHMNFDFEVYWLDSSGNKVMVNTHTWSDIVIPANSTNLVYFKWTVPENSAGTILWCKGTANVSGSVGDNNSTVFNLTVVSRTESQTPDTSYEDKAPDDYAKVNTPTESAGSATWNMWVYNEGKFNLISYGARISAANPVIMPGAGCKTASYSSGRWTMRAGYGITIEWDPRLVSFTGYVMPGSDSYTKAQNVFALFPEYKYSIEAGVFRTLENTGGIFRFIENSCADGNERLHFIPVYIEDGDYTVSVTATQIWTPAGMITATRNSNTVTIDGTIFDDWYQY